MQRRVTLESGRPGLRSQHAADSSQEAQIGAHITPRSDGCWQWKDGTVKYPTVLIYGEYQLVHRWMFFLANRLDPQDYAGIGWHVHHECENKNCVNPEHMRLMTPKEHAVRHRELRAIH